MDSSHLRGRRAGLLSRAAMTWSVEIPPVRVVDLCLEMEAGFLGTLPARTSATTAQPDRELVL